MHCAKYLQKFYDANLPISDQTQKRKNRTFACKTKYLKKKVLLTELIFNGKVMARRLTKSKKK